FEETGLRVSVGAPCLVNEFHDPKSGFHQIEVFFRCSLTDGAEIEPHWKDPEEVVNRHVWAARDDFARLRVKPDALERIAFEPTTAPSYDPLETIVS
ncbi:MAG: NUDIX hydrolase, partial [Roseobacter sp.]